MCLRGFCFVCFVAGGSGAAVVPSPRRSPQVPGLHRLGGPYPKARARHAGEGVPPAAGGGGDHDPEVGWWVGFVTVL